MAVKNSLQTDMEMKRPIEPNDFDREENIKQMKATLVILQEQMDFYKTENEKLRSTLRDLPVEAA